MRRKKEKERKKRGILLPGGDSFYLLNTPPLLPLPPSLPCYWLENECKKEVLTSDEVNENMKSMSADDKPYLKKCVMQYKNDKVTSIVNSG